MDAIFDAESGVSGDMIVGALIDLCEDKNCLAPLTSLKLKSQIQVQKIAKNGVFATDFDVILQKNNHDHDLNFLYNKQEKRFEIGEKRNIFAIKKLIEDSALSNSSKALAIKIFEIVGEAEAKAHKIDLKDVLFHESGAMDSIIDICSAAILVDKLKLNKVYVKNLREGKGEINCRVGKLPIPTPAVKNIIQKFNIKLESAPINYELITPTGLAILSAISNFDPPPSDYQVVKVGYGNGKRDYGLLGVLKVQIIKCKE